MRFIGSIIVILILFSNIFGSEDSPISDPLTAKKVDEGNVSYRHGLKYQLGVGVEQDYNKAFKLFRKAAEDGNVPAQYSVGVMYYSGQGVGQNTDKAVNWYWKAAKNGHAEAQFVMGWMFEAGQGVEKNIGIAVKWYLKAAGQGNAEAQFNLGWLYDTGQGVRKNMSIAVEWYRKAAEQRHGYSQIYLGRMYAKGRGVEKNDFEAFKWFYKAAEQGMIRAQLNIGGMYYAGEKKEQNYAKAANWYRLAAEQGDALAQYNLGGMYANGQGVEHDYIWAYVWLSLSAEQDYRPSMIHLDRLRGAMTKKQIVLAEKELYNERTMGSEDNSDNPSDPRKMDETPKIIYKVDPVFPSVLDHTGVGKKVVVSYIVDEAGMVQYPRIDTSADYILDFAVLDAIKKWRFTPGVHKGKIVKTRMRSVYSVQEKILM